MQPDLEPHPLPVPLSPAFPPQVADLVFPVFVWMQGVSMAISHASLRSRNARRRDMAWKVTLRSLKLYGLGLFVNNIAALSQARLLGVLQYFAAANLAIGLLDVFVPLLPAVAPAALPGDGSSGAARSSALSRLRAALWQDVGRYATQWAAMAVLAATYLGLQFGLPVPGCPTGYIGAGGLADDGAYPQCTGGAHRYIDELVFGTAHIYHNEDASGECSAERQSALRGAFSACFSHRTSASYPPHVAIYHLTPPLDVCR